MSDPTVLPAEPLAEWERELLEPALPESLTLENRCDACGAAALHAYKVHTAETTTVMLFCNHHAREVHPKLRDCEHRDYRMTQEAALQEEARQRAAYEEADRKAQKMRGVDGEPNYHPIPVYLTQWDLRWWK